MPGSQHNPQRMRQRSYVGINQMGNDFIEETCATDADGMITKETV